MLKKILCILVSVTALAGILTSCSRSGGSSQPAANSDVSASDGSITEEQAHTAAVETGLTIDGKEIDTTDLVMCTINGQEVSFDEFRFYWLTYLKSYENAGFDLSSPDTIESVKAAVMTELTDTYGVISMGLDNGITFGDDLKETADANYLDLISGFDTVEGYKEALISANMTDDLVWDYFYTTACYGVARNAILSETGPYAKTKDDFMKSVENGEFSRTLNLLIPYACGAELSAEDMEAWDELTVSDKSAKYNNAYDKLSDDEKKTAQEKAKALADEVLAKVKAGEDFYKLIDEYNLDPGMYLNDQNDITSITGYYITKDYGFVQEYIDSAFSLAENETSDLVETTYGYHIIKRLPLDMDYINENIDSLTKEYSETYIYKACNDYMDSVKYEYSEYYDKLNADSIV